MGLREWLEGFDKKAKKPVPTVPTKGREFVLSILPTGQIVWYDTKGKTFLEQGYLGNHVVFSIVDWISSKMADAPVLLYEVKDKKHYKRYKQLLREGNRDSVQRALDIKSRALEEVENSDMLRLFEKPNEYQSWREFIYGYYVYKSIVGSSYTLGIRPSEKGKIMEMWQLPAHKMQIETGPPSRIIDYYYRSDKPGEKILAENVLQLRNFNPIHENGTEWLYGMSKLHAISHKMKEYNEGTAALVDMYEKRGIRDIVFPKGHPDLWSEEAVGDALNAQEHINQKWSQSGTSGIIANSVELGSIRVGLSPQELGILENQSITKKDFCALFHVPATIFDWNPDGTTYNNLSESRKIGLTDAVIPELETLKDGLNHWLIPSWYPKGDYVIDFDYEFYPELQEDIAETVKWMNAAGCLTTNEKREKLRYDRSMDENADKVLVPSNLQLLEEVGVGSFESDPETEPAEL